MRSPFFDCDALRHFAKVKSGRCVASDDSVQIDHAIDIADCCRQAGQFEIAIAILDHTSTFVTAEHEPYKREIDAERRLVEQRSTHGNEFGEFHATVEMPSVFIRGINFAGAMARWASTGFKLRSQVEIDERLAICQACPKLQGDTCSVCGCNCNANGVINKLALKGQACPLGKWS